jgi:hypothetical protein
MARRAYYHGGGASAAVITSNTSENMSLNPPPETQNKTFIFDTQQPPNSMRIAKPTETSHTLLKSALQIRRNEYAEAPTHCYSVID